MASSIPICNENFENSDDIESIPICTDNSVTNDDITNILAQFGFPELIETFKNSEIDVDCLQFITDDDLIELIPKLGVRIKFRVKLNEWRSKNRDAGLPVRKKIVHGFDVNSIDLVKLLLKSDIGKSIIDYYKKETKLDELMRKNLIKNVTSFFVEEGISLGTKECNILADKIVDLFPNEEKCMYFIPAIGKKNAEGSLYTKYNNTLSFYKQKGLIETPQTSVKIRKVESTEGDRRYDKAEDTTVEEDKEFLKKFNKPWDVVTTKWRRTFTIRRDELFSAKTLANFLCEWPLLKNDSYGPLLIHIDFDLIPDTKAKIDICGEWDVFFKKIKDICTSKFKNKEQKLLLAQLSSTDEETRNIAAIQCLIHLIPPRCRIKRVDNSTWKPSIPDSIKALILHIGPINNIDKATEELVREQKTLTNHCPPVIGIADGPKYFIILEGIFYPMETVLNSLDLLFKIYFVFNLDYPVQTVGFYNFIQEYFYEIKANELNADVMTLISQLKD